MATRRVVVVAASAGGVEALQRMVGALPADLDAAVLVVLHMAANGSSSLARILDRAGPLTAKPAEDGEALVGGTVYICVADQHLVVAPGHVHLRRGPHEHGHRPAADPLFRSAALHYGPAVIGVVLSGSLSDGTAGLNAVRRSGGVAVVQDPADALFPDMPNNALEYVGADHVVAADEIGRLLGDLVARSPEGATSAVSKLLQQEVGVIEDDDRVLSEDHPGVPSSWPCPDCNGVLWQVEDDAIVRFRCRVGHAWAAEELAEAQRVAIDTALWTALRSLEDRVALMRMLAERAVDAGRTIGATRFQSNREEYERSAQVIRDLLTRPTPPPPGDER